MAGETLEEIAFENAADLEAWLSANHDCGRSIWAVLAKKGTDGHIQRDMLLDILIRFGWIDSLPRKHSETRSKLLLSPRKPGSAWSALNKRVAQSAMQAGRMHPTGLAAIERAKADGSWTFLDDVEAGIIPEDLAKALNARPPSATMFEAFPKSAKRGILEWIKQAKQPHTRERRVRETAELAAQGKRALDWKATRSKG